MENSKIQFKFKILLIGNQGTGKTTFLNRIYENKYLEEEVSTIGVDFKVIKEKINNSETMFVFWDSAGQERFRSISCCYIKGADIILLFFDLTNKRSFENLPYWIQQIKNQAPERCFVTLIGTKSDLISERVVDFEEIQLFQKEYGIQKYFEVSNKHNINVKAVYSSILENEKVQEFTSKSKGYFFQASKSQTFISECKLFLKKIENVCCQNL